MLGTAGKLNLMFRKPVRWKHGGDDPESDAVFRYLFAVDTIADFEAATLAVLDGDDFAPGYFQVYCEGAGLRQLSLDEPFDRLTVFFKNLALGKTGEQLTEVEAEVKQIILSSIENPEDCAWTRLLTPRDLQQTFGFPGGNIEHTMLVEGQSYFDRQYATDANRRFYQFGEFENVSICGSSTYPCGSVAGTPGYMCASELLRHMAKIEAMSTTPPISDQSRSRDQNGLRSPGPGIFEPGSRSNRPAGFRHRGFRSPSE